MNNETCVINLDYWAAFHAQKIIKESDNNIETTVTKTMDVLREHGVYACFLYLLAKEKDNSHNVICEMLELLYHLGYCWEKNKKPETVEDVLNFINEKVSNGSVERLLFAKEILDQMLIYARYGAKANEKKQEKDKAVGTEILDDADDTKSIVNELDQEKST